MRAGELNDKKARSRRTRGGTPMFEIPGMPGAQMRRMISIGDISSANGRPDQDPPLCRVVDLMSLVNENPTSYSTTTSLTAESIHAV